MPSLSSLEKWKALNAVVVVCTLCLSRFPLQIYRTIVWPSSIHTWTSYVEGLRIYIETGPIYFCTLYHKPTMCLIKNIYFVRHQCVTEKCITWWWINTNLKSQNQCAIINCKLTDTLQWCHNERWRFKSPASPLFAHLLAQAQIKENIKFPRHGPLSGEFAVGRWIPRTKRPVTPKMFPVDDGKPHSIRDTMTW